MRLRFQHRFATNIDEAAADKVCAAETDISAVRLAVIAFITVVYVFLFDKSGSVQWLAYGTLAIAWVYGTLVLALQPHRRHPALLSSYFTSTSDAALITVWLFASGGFYSPFYVLWYGSIVAVAYRYTPRETMIASALYAASYLALVDALGETSDRATDLVVRVGFIFLVGVMSSLLSREALGQSRARVDARRAAQRAAAAEARFRGLLESAPDPMIIVDGKGSIVLINGETESAFGYSREEVLGQTVEVLIPEILRETHVSYRIPNCSHPNTRQMGAGLELVGRRSDGSEFPVEIRLSPMDAESGPLVTTVVRDISERKRAETALRESEAHFRALIENTSDFIIVLNADGTVRYASPSVGRELGYSFEEFAGKNGFEFVHPDDGEELLGIFSRRLQERGVGVPIEFRLRRKDGSWRLVEAIANFDLLDDPAVGGIILNARDITEHREAEETIARLAYHDSLTGLPNRVLFEDRLSVALAQARRSKEMLAVLFLDLDRFKLVNDTLGHAGGDELLRLVAADLNQALRDGDTLARIGGDEFTLLLPRIRHKEDAIDVAERILQMLEKPRTLEGYEFTVTPSIGISIYPRDGAAEQELLANADTAMYRAKERGRNNCQLYTRAMRADVLGRLDLERDLRRALDHDEFVLYYQPILDTRTGEIVAAEALVRWRHPTRGLVYPNDFIPFAEELGLLTAIEEWVLAEACGQKRDWQQKGYPQIRMSVNLSARQLQRKEMAPLVSRILNEAGLSGEHLQLEITEGVMVENAGPVAKTLRHLRRMGVRISIDDFGTGYSSLSYLKRFPIDEVKIDKSFVRDLAVDPNDAAIVSTIITMAHDLKLGVVGEGVETADQLSFLTERGCDSVQGYLFSEPVPAPRFEELLCDTVGYDVDAMGEDRKWMAPNSSDVQILKPLEVD